MMRVDFPGGVSDECVAWLREHVGAGGDMTRLDRRFDQCEWFYERRFQPYDEQIHDEQPTQGDYIPSITIRDGNSREALWFALRWSGS